MEAPEASAGNGMHTLTTGRPDADEAPVQGRERPGTAVRPEAEGQAREDGTTGLQVIGQVLFQIVIGLVILGASIGATWLLVSLKTAPAIVPEAAPAPNVIVQRVSVGDVPTKVHGYGSVRAARQIQLIPQVSGRVVAIHPGLVVGGRIPGGATVLQVDATDYELAVEQAEASLTRAQAGLTGIDAARDAAAADVARRETALQTTLAEAEVAQAEFERINPGEEIAPLVARQPQVREAQAALEAARASLEQVDAEEQELEAQLRQAEVSLRQAQVNLARTEIKLPDGSETWRVSSESVDIGQTVAPGQSIAVLYDARSLEVPVPLEDRQLQWIHFPLDPSSRGSSAVISTQYAGAERKWSAHVDRTEGQINPRTRLVEVVVVADDPTSDGATLVPGLFVDVTIEGSTLENVAAVPRRVVHPGDGQEQVVHVAADGKLAIRPVTIVRRAGDTVYVRGLEDGERVILTRLDIAAAGMAIQVGGEENASDAATRQAEASETQ